MKEGTDDTRGTSRANLVVLSELAPMGAGVGHRALTNLACIFLVPTLTVFHAAMAGLVLILTPVPVMYAYGGMNRLMSAGHLVAWSPLDIYLGWRLWSPASDLVPGSAEAGDALLPFFVNAISL